MTQMKAQWWKKINGQTAKSTREQGTCPIWNLGLLGLLGLGLGLSGLGLGFGLALALGLTLTLDLIALGFIWGGGGG